MSRAEDERTTARGRSLDLQRVEHEDGVINTSGRRSDGPNATGSSERRHFSFTKVELLRSTSERTSWGENPDGNTTPNSEPPVQSGRRRSDVEKETAMRALLDSAGHDAAVKDLMAGGPEKIVDIMLEKLDNMRVQADGCEALTNLALNDTKAQGRIGQAGGIHVVTRALGKHGSSREVQEKGIAALCSMTLVQSNRALIGRLRGAEFAIEAMKKFCDVPAIHVESCTLLANVAFGDREQKLKLGRNGGITAVIVAMQDYPNDFTIQTRGCLALRNMAWNMDENQQLIGSAGGIDVMLNAMNRHSRASMIVEQSVIALCNIVLEDERNQELLVRGNGIPCLLGAMRSNLGNDVIQEHAISLLNCVVVLGRLSRDAFADAGGVEIILRTMKLHMVHEGVLLKCALVVRHLMNFDNFRDQILRHGGLETMADALCLMLRSGSTISPTSGGH